MKRSISIKQISLEIITILLVAMWLLVSLEKLWDLNVFHISLKRQPFPNWWASILFWLLPILELIAAVLIAWPKKKKVRHWGMWLSFVLMLGFTLFIAFGVMGLYAKRPCSCSSVIASLSWNQHLWFNMFFLALSAIGIWLSKPKKISDQPYSYSKSINLWFKNKKDIPFIRYFSWYVFEVFKELFAVFRQRAEEKTPCHFQIKPNLMMARTVSEKTVN